MSFRSVVLNRTGIEFFINIILDIEKAKILAVAWLSFFVGLIFISYSCLFTTTITTWPITPRSTVTWLIAETCTIWNFVRFHCWGRTCKLKRALNLIKAVNISNILWKIQILRFSSQNFNFISVHTLNLCFWSIVFICWNRNVRYLNWTFWDISKTSTESRSSRQSPSSPNEWIGKSSLSSEWILHSFGLKFNVLVHDYFPEFENTYTA